MDRLPVRYVVLRDRDVWESENVTRIGLEADAAGVIALMRVPGPADGQPLVHPGPYDIEPSGLAAADNGDVYVAATAEHSVLGIWHDCGEKIRLGHGAGSGLGQFNRPRGMLLADGRLYVADSANARIVVLDRSTLEVLDAWDDRLREPASMAADSDGRIYVLDRRLNAVLRFDRHGVMDARYGDAMSSQARPDRPVAIAIDGGDYLYVSDEGNGIATFDTAGQFLESLAKAGGPGRPRALAASGPWLYAADAERGWIYAHRARHGWLGTLPGYRGPVSAMTVDSRGRLFLKPALGVDVTALEADAAYISSGTLTAGPFDAGDRSQWERVHADVDLPAGTSAELRLFTSPPSAADSSLPNAGPAGSDWASDDKTLAAALDTLVPDAWAANARADGARYLWLRLHLTSTDPRRSPRLRQVEAATPARSYLDDLPAVYRREDEPGRFLERWLAWLRADLVDWERDLDAVSRTFDPETAPDHQLPFLARWLAFRLPTEKHAGEWRKLIADIYRLYQRRGTPMGLREFCEIYAGVRPLIFEAFRDRHIWQLGHPSSTLGFGTGLAPALPDGMVVPGFMPADPAFRGLRADYYSGTNFDQLEATRIDPFVHLDVGLGSPIPGVVGTDQFSVRWSGQVQPRYTELYTFETASDDGVRLWVNGRLIIDDWHDHGRTENRGQIALTAGRWYAITLEYYDLVSAASVSLSWASPSQGAELVPSDRLYAIVDETVRLDEASAGPLLVGQTVVGESGPLAQSDFGAPLFSDTAHLFTVLVPAAALHGPASRHRLTEIVEAERPAHTDFHLCLVAARMRVGFQARLGVDAIVAGLPDPLSLGGSRLDVDSYLGIDGARDGGAARIGRRARVGTLPVAGLMEQR